MNTAGERLYNGIVKENPTFVMMLGMCPTLAVTAARSPNPEQKSLHPEAVSAHSG